MAFLQEIKITETAPAVGSTRQPNTIFIVPITDKTCDMYASDNNGIVRATSVQVPVFNSIEEANSSISPANRFEGKTIIIKKTYSKEIPVLDEEGDPVLDEEGEPVMETISTNVYFQYWWRNGIEDENLISFAPPLSAVLENGNEVPVGKELIFLSIEEANVPPEYRVSEGLMRLGVGKDATNFYLTNSGMKEIEGDNLFYHNFLLGGIAARKHKGPLFSTIAIGGNLGDICKTSAAVALGTNVMTNFRGVAPAETDYYDYKEPWGTVNFNSAIGYSAGQYLQEGFGNILIGNCTSSPSNREMNHTLMIGSDRRFVTFGKYSKRYSSSSNELKSPIIVGKFDEKWLEINGVLKLRPHYNKLKKEGDAVSLANAEVTKQQANVDRMTARLAVLQTRKDENAGTEFEDDHNKAFTRGQAILNEYQAELTRAQDFANQQDVPNYVEDAILIADTTNMGEVVLAKKTDFVLDVIREMSPEQLTELKTILGVTTEPEA